MYEWKQGYSRSVDADVAGAVCEELERDGGLTAGRLVDASRPEEAPLHPEFEWDDATAAEEYRKVQAGGIIRQLVKVMATGTGDEQTRAFVHVRPAEGACKSYVGIEVAMRDSDMRAQLLADAYADAAAYERKYKSLAEVASVIAAIRALPPEP